MSHAEKIRELETNVKRTKHAVYDAIRRHKLACDALRAFKASLRRSK